MKKISYFISILLISMSFNVYADDASKQVLIKELLTLTKVNTVPEKTKKQLEGSLSLYFSQLGGKKEENKEVYEKYLKEFSTAFDKNINWKKLESDYINMYDKLFTEKEIKTIVQFYQTPAGKKMEEKSADIMRQAIEINKKQMTTVTPALRNVMQKMSKELTDTQKEKSKKKTEEKSKKKVEEKK